MGAAAALVVPFVTELLSRRSRRLASLQAIRDELAVNANALTANEGDPMRAASPTLLVYSAFSADLALWGSKSRAACLQTYHILAALSGAVAGADQARSNEMLLPPRTVGAFTLRVSSPQVQDRKDEVIALRGRARTAVVETLELIDAEITRVREWEAERE